MTLRTDFHSHILPDMDDGSRCAEDSLKMLRMEAEQGVTRVVATPHFYAHSDNPERFLAKRAQSFEMLREVMKEQTGMPEVAMGAEVYYFRGMSESEALSELTLADSRAILIEMPHAPWTPAMYRELEAIYAKRGLTPVVAHIDRYISPLRTHGIPKRLEELPVLVQANAEFFISLRTRSMALKMLKDGRIHLLGSDCHDLTARKPNLGAAMRVIEKRFGTDALRRITEYEGSDIEV